MKKIFYLLTLSVIFLIPVASKAYVVKSDSFVYVGKDEIIEGNLYFSANSLNIEGQVLGDVIGIANNVQINGNVKGDLINISQNTDINGNIEGNLRLISNVLNLKGSVGKNINLLSESFILGEDASVGQDILLTSINSELNGKVGGNIHGYAESIIIRGEIGQDLNLKFDQKKSKKYTSKLQIDESAIINGSLNYKSGSEAIIHSQNIKGSINRQEPTEAGYKQISLEKFIYSFFSLLLTALLINFLFNKKIQSLKNIIIKENYKLSLYGLAFLFLTPIACLILMLTIIGLPIALIILALWAILLFLSKIIASLALSDYLFKLFNKEKINNNLKISAGIFLFCILVSIPYIGWFFSLLALLAGLGSIYFYIKNKNYVN